MHVYPKTVLRNLGLFSLSYPANGILELSGICVQSARCGQAYSDSLLPARPQAPRTLEDVQSYDVPVMCAGRRVSALAGHLW